MLFNQCEGEYHGVDPCSLRSDLSLDHHAIEVVVVNMPCPFVSPLFDPEALRWLNFTNFFVELLQVLQLFMISFFDKFQSRKKNEMCGIFCERNINSIQNKRGIIKIKMHHRISIGFRMRDQ